LNNSKTTGLNLDNIFKKNYLLKNFEFKRLVPYLQKSRL